jgi:Trehalase
MGKAGVASAVADTGADSGLERRAMDVLHANSLGPATSPSLRLYPHQWSWDAACIAMGYAPHDQERAETELRSLFAGQWRNGMLPHIVFTEGARYFPGPEFWQTERSPDPPERPRTSGIVQPPLHATAALRVYRHARDGVRAAAFLEELFPALRAWHQYLYRERTRGDELLVEIWHPWESGMDNSPVWDEALAAIQVAEDDVPEYRRVDIDVADAAERPSNEHYDRYAYLVHLFRSLGYRAEHIREECPFLMQPVLFNAILAQADRDLAQIARAVGADARPFDQRAGATSAALEKLWDEDRGVYVDFDLRSGRPARTWTSAGLAPLYAGIPTRGRAERMLETLATTGVEVHDGWAVTSLPPEDPRFQPALYWRGPVWPILNWVLFHGLARYGYGELAARVRAGMLGLARRGGFWEHYDPLTGRGHGGPEFAWTAALLLDLMASDSSSVRPQATD